VKSLFAKADIQTDVPDNILHLLWTSHSTAVGLGAGLAKSRGVTPFLHDKTSMTQGYYVVKELFELCRLRGVDPYKYPDQAFLFKMPVWLFMVVLRLFCSYNAGVPRVLAHVAEPAYDARELYVAMMKTAQELKFDMPRTKAVGVYLQTT